MLHAVDTLTLAQQSLPQGGSIPLGIALCAGLLLWLMGAKLIKPVFMLFGLAIGGFVGATIIPLTGLGNFDLGSVTISPGAAGLVVGGLIGALVSLSLMRVVITMSAGIAFAAAGLLGALVYLHFNPAQQDLNSTEPAAAAVEPGAFDALTESIALEAAERSVDRINERNPLFDDETKQDIIDAAARSRAFVSRVVDNVQDELATRTAREKTIAFASMFGGLAFGLLLGITMPTRTAALVTSLLGSAVWIGAGIALMTAKNGEIPAFLDRSAVVWSAAWIGITMLGLLAQLGFLKRSPRKNRADDDDED